MKKIMAVILTVTFICSSLGLNVFATNISDEKIDKGYYYAAPKKEVAKKKSAPKSKPKETITNSTPYNKRASIAKQYYDDVVGWLRIPNSNINTPILQRAEKVNDYYLSHNIKGQLDKNGSNFADRRCDFSTGKREDLSWNTVLYGHSWTDNLNGSLFDQIKRFRNVEYAKSQPYIYFSTTEENMAWEVFAVFDADINLPYNRPDLEGKQREQLLNIVKSLSIYDYGIELKPDDKILTLSTCTYQVAGFPKQKHPTDFRYVVMARLVPKGQATKTSASFTINENPRSASFSNYIFNF